MSNREIYLINTLTIALGPIAVDILEDSDKILVPPHSLINNTRRGYSTYTNQFHKNLNVMRRNPCQSIFRGDHEAKRRSTNICESEQLIP